MVPRKIHIELMLDLAASLNMVVQEVCLDVLRLSFVRPRANRGVGA
jgi:hypothetical protein